MIDIYVCDSCMYEEGYRRFVIREGYAFTEADEDSFFEYETMGFGEVIKSEDELIDSLIEYMENDCQMKNEYVERVENFFIYTDKNNCKRVYDKIKEIPLKD
jgi:CDP-glycerol glycerophosphotransferase (TagB/SpsB family)